MPLRVASSACCPWSLKSSSNLAFDQNVSLDPPLISSVVNGWRSEVGSTSPTQPHMYVSKSALPLFSGAARSARSVSSSVTAASSFDFAVSMLNERSLSAAGGTYHFDWKGGSRLVPGVPCPARTLSTSCGRSTAYARASRNAGSRVADVDDPPPAIALG